MLIYFAYVLTHSLTYLLAHLITYLLTPWSRILSEKLTGSQLVKIFPAFYGTWRFITAFACARNLSLSRIRSIQSMPHIQLPKIHLNIVLPSTPESSKWTLSIRFPNRYPVCTPIRATCHALLILLDLITRTILSEQYRSLSSSLCSLLHSPVTSSLWGYFAFVDSTNDYNKCLVVFKTGYLILFVSPKLSSINDSSNSEVYTRAVLSLRTVVN
jgi:hypothetical protein